ncbi:MAG: MFS transporter [Verrucomicrobiales bacterium]|nr:MFS transporter [Verrucomicrobiales bacterium]
MQTTVLTLTATSPWWKLLNRYHWFVLIVAALGWLFDCLDQQLFLLARVPAMKSLLQPGQNVAEYSGYATAIFLIGWATGGLTFGVLGDRIGRAKTMMLTILIYSLCTGLSALSKGFWDFAFYRFVTGLGVGGEFAVGVALVAEVMPDRARTNALGLLQALSATGNVSAALISIGFGDLEASGVIKAGSAWRWMFVIGAVPAVLALVIRARLKEPERWRAAKAAGQEHKLRLGSYGELFGNANWHRAASVAALAVVAIIAMAFAAPAPWPKLRIGLGLSLVVVVAGAVSIFGGGGSPRWRKNAVVGLVLACAGVLGLWGIAFFSFDLVRLVFQKAFAAQGLTPAEISGKLTIWAGVTSIMQNVGGFFGIYTFGVVSQRLGRRPTFAVAFTLAMLSTAAVFWFLEPGKVSGKLTFWEQVACFHQIFWLIPIMGFFQLSLFGGYAIYFPELFPTHLRSTGTSFCYNVGRFVAASGPTILGLLTSRIFTEAHGYTEGMRYAGLTMCSVFFVGLAVLPFAPETKGQPLPEAEASLSH